MKSPKNNEKNPWIASFLAAFFGPLGVLYASWKVAVILTIALLTLDYYLHFVYAYLIVWFIGVFWATYTAESTKI